MSDQDRASFVEQMREQEFSRSQVAVTADDYTKSVLILAKVAQGDTSGSRAAAQVLLSLYDGSNWNMNLTDLCVLDFGLFAQALIAIRGRVTVFEEPHNVIENGSQIFANLEKQWQHLHTSKRYNETGN